MNSKAPVRTKINDPSYFFPAWPTYLRYNRLKFYWPHRHVRTELQSKCSIMDVLCFNENKLNFPHFVSKMLCVVPDSTKNSWNTSTSIQLNVGPLWLWKTVWSTCCDKSIWSHPDPISGISVCKLEELSIKVEIEGYTRDLSRNGANQFAGAQHLCSTIPVLMNTINLH